MSPIPLLALLLCCTSRAGGAKMKLQPEKLTGLQGEEARFTCTTDEPKWGAMIWQLRGKTVLTIIQQSGPVSSGNPNITAVKVEGGWSLVLKNTQREYEGVVTCDLQEVSKRTAYLYVQEKGKVRILGQSRMAFKDQTVEFECQAAGWSPLPTLHWNLNGRQVNTADYNLSSEQTGQGQFSVSSNLSVRASSSCDVHCLVSVSAMTVPLNSTVRLTVVAEVLEDGDSNVAVVLLGSLTALLSLALICIATVLCLRRRERTESGLEQAIRFGQSENGRISVAGVTHGKVNLGYSNDRDTFYNDLIIGPPIPITTFNSHDKVPDLVSSSSQSFQSDTLSQHSTQQIRSITTV
ncbi:hypothetical protein NL108_017473 [Boleophthalmus pectinirostris]|uniref:immunoglobulin superfamily member 5-like n=1 Tax=Boleophthalmus pectinirostris TaxID=150288 RepID=UPI0024312C34|nr:immunoglobulin superfamily member 5-like [Boleophthalmus pectinirostris]KAJ0064033.1 hypothetical protein NL108_017473 [Boleophthalmus pectinirostris]